MTDIGVQRYSEKRGCECEKRLNAHGSRDTGEALRPVFSSE